MVRRVETLTKLLDQEQRDQRLIARLEEIPVLEAATGGTGMGGFDDADVVRAYAKLFAEQNLAPEQVTIAEAAARMNGRSPRVRTALLMALDDWASTLKSQSL